MSPATERLTAATRRLYAAGVQIPHRYLRDMAVDGLIPAHQVNHIWHYRVADLDQIAQVAKLHRNGASRQAA